MNEFTPRVRLSSYQTIQAAEKFIPGVLEGWPAEPRKGRVASVKPLLRHGRRSVRAATSELLYRVAPEVTLAISHALPMPTAATLAAARKSP